MSIEVDQYRESIGKYYTVARSVKKGKLLSITDIACFNLLLLYGTKITPLLILNGKIGGGIWRGLFI
jgi:hypothetical protein